MVKVVVTEAAGDTLDGIPYTTDIFDPKSITATRIVLTAEIAAGPLAGETERTEWIGTFKPSGKGTIDTWLAKVHGQIHYSIDFDPGLRVVELFDDFEAAFRAGIDYRGNGFANLLEGDVGADRLDGGRGADILKGLGGADVLLGGAGADDLAGGAGADRLDGGAGNDDLDGGKGRDVMSGGSGDDVYHVSTSERDSVVELEDGGYDTVVLLDGWPYFMPENVEEVRVVTNTLEAANVIGNDLDNVMRQGSLGGPLSGGKGADLLIGAGGGDSLYGGAGNDKVRGAGGVDYVAGGAGRDRLLGGGGADTLDGYIGNDRMDGGNGDDWLIGGTGRDTMTGGDDSDRFTFYEGNSGTSAATRDSITDFVSGVDIIDIESFASKFIGSGGFSGKSGEANYQHGILRVDVDGDGIADFSLKLEGAPNLATGDLLL